MLNKKFQRNNVTGSCDIKYVTLSWDNPRTSYYYYYYVYVGVLFILQYMYISCISQKIYFVYLMTKLPCTVRNIKHINMIETFVVNPCNKPDKIDDESR